MTHLKPLAICLFAATFVTACDQPNTPIHPIAQDETPVAAPPAMVDAPTAAVTTPMTSAASALVTMKPAPGGVTAGQLTATQTAGGVRFVGRIDGLTAGSEHGFHVHDVGDCSAPDFSSAGGHFNPMDMSHGNPESPPHHAGDLPNLRADTLGSSDVDFTVAGLTLGDGGTTDISGRAVLVHIQPDDYTSQPSGASGARIACGVIGEE